KAGAGATAGAGVAASGARVGGSADGSTVTDPGDLSELSFVSFGGVSRIGCPTDRCEEGAGVRACTRAGGSMSEGAGDGGGVRRKPVPVGRLSPTELTRLCQSC